LFLLYVCLFVSCNSYACYPALLAKNLYWEGILLVHTIPKNQVTSKESTINSYAWYFKPFQVNFHVLPFKKPSNTSHFVPLFLAHEDVVVGFVIFHTKLSTPRLGSFICSSLILQGSWSVHCNFKQEKKKEHSSMVCESWWAPDGIG
jgi:hypothetical protein